MKYSCDFSVKWSFIKGYSSRLDNHTNSLLKNSHNNQRLTSISSLSLPSSKISIWSWLLSLLIFPSYFRDRNHTSCWACYMHSMGALDIKFKLPNDSKIIRYELCLWTDFQISQVTHSRSHWWPIIECRVDAGPQSGVPRSVFFPLCFVTHVQESQDSLFIWSAVSSFTLESLYSISQVLDSYLLCLSFCLILLLQFWLWLHLCWVL